METSGPPPRVSVVLPVYNGMPFLPEAVESIRSQTLADWELIAVDDGSTDGSLDWLRHAAAADGRLRVVVHASNRGIAAAYNTGLGAARARHVAFQEQDDISLPARLERQLAAMERHGAPIVSSRVGLLDAGGRVYASWPDDLAGDADVTPAGFRAGHAILVAQTNIANATMLIDRSVLDPADLRFDEQFVRCCQDSDWQIRLLRRHPSLRLADVLVYQRRAAGHASATSQPTAMIPDMRRLLAKHGRPPGDGAPLQSALATWFGAWSTQLYFEAGCRRGGASGWLLAVAALLLWPANPRIWRTVRSRLGSRGRGGRLLA